MSIKHIFFDLDRTLWDFEYNSKTTLLELISQFDLLEKGVSNAQDFIAKYQKNNERLWDLYRKDKITKQELRGKRFLLTLKEYNIHNSRLAEDFGLEYIKQSPLKTQLFPYTIETLSYLIQKYKLHIITNGFEEVQQIKLISSGLMKYFDVIITSEQVGVKKPDPKIFHYAFREANTQKENSIMIGDDLLVDIIGAQKVGMNAIYFNPKKMQHSQSVWKEIYCLKDLIALL